MLYGMRVFMAMFGRVALVWAVAAMRMFRAIGATLMFALFVLNGVVAVL